MRKPTLLNVILLIFALAGPTEGEKVLNNFVSELLNVSSQAIAGGAEYVFTNPREGWVFFQSTLAASSSASIQFSVDGKPGQDGVIIHGPGGQVVEGMRYLARGIHTLHIKVDPVAELDGLVVRTMPEILYANFPMSSPITAYPNYDWAFLKRSGLFDNINTIVGARHGSSAARVKVKEEFEPHLSEWKKLGRRWIVESPVPGFSQGERITADDAYAIWSAWKGMRYPKLDGIIADEFLPRRRENYQAWIEAIIRIQEDHAPKTFYPYVAGRPNELEEFLIPLVKSGTRFAYERYLHERPTEQEAWSFIKDRLVGKMTANLVELFQVRA